MRAENKSGTGQVSNSRRGILIAGISAFFVGAPYELQTLTLVEHLSMVLRMRFPEIANLASALKQSSDLAIFGKNRSAMAEAIFSVDLSLFAAQQPQEIVQFLARKVDRDFIDNRLVRLKGWTLSETEIQLIAFIAMD